MAVGIFLNVFTFFMGIISIVLDQHAESEEMAYQAVQHQGEGADVNADLNAEAANPVVPEPAAQQQQVGFLSHAFDFKEISNYPRLFWYMAIFYAIVYASVLALVNVSVGYFTETWLVGVDEPEKIAARMIAVMWFVTGSLTPIFGMIVDYFGHRSAMSLLSASLCVTSHGLVLINQPFVGLMFLGFSLALAFASIWTGIVFVIPADQYGKAFGVIVSLYNAGFTVVPLAVGAMRAYTKSYLIAQIFLAVLGILAFVFSVLIYIEDHNTGRRIDKGIYVETSQMYVLIWYRRSGVHTTRKLQRNYGSAIVQRNRQEEERKD